MAQHARNIIPKHSADWMLYGVIFIIIGALLQNPRAIIAGVVTLAIAAWYRKTHRRPLTSVTTTDAPIYVRKPISEATRHEVWRRDQGRCVDCGGRHNLEFDHILPVIKGGSNTTRNIELRCETCNRRKGARV